MRKRFVPPFVCSFYIFRILNISRTARNRPTKAPQLSQFKLLCNRMMCAPPICFYHSPCLFVSSRSHSPNDTAAVKTPSRKCAKYNCADAKHYRRTRRKRTADGNHHARILVRLQRHHRAKTKPKQNTLAKMNTKGIATGGMK